MNQHTIKVLSYNIHKGFDARNSEFVLPNIREALHRVHADIVFLQEVQGKHKIRKLKKVGEFDLPQYEYLANDIWPHFIYAKNAVYQTAHHGNALLSRYPFASHENIDVSFAKRASRSLLHGVITTPFNGTKIHVICIHLGLFKSERRIQLSVLSRRIKEHVPDNEPLIIAGDFNDWRRDAESHLQQDLGLCEAFVELTGSHAKSFPALRPTLTVDRIYYRGIKPLDCVCKAGPPWRKLSDHLPLWMKFQL